MTRASLEHVNKKIAQSLTAAAFPLTLVALEGEAFMDFRNAYGRNAGLRIDHFLLSPDMESRLVGGGVDKHVQGWDHTSDHAPTWIELSDNEPKGKRWNG